MMAFAIVSTAKTSKISGKIVAYDVMKHSSKSASDMQNQEVVVLESSGQKQKYVKVMFSSFGTTQIDPKYFDGTQPLEANVLRDHTCDEKAPTFVTQVSLEQIGGTYLLTDAFKSQPPGRIKTLECYVAIYKKNK
jgi:4-hydroxy-3-methylbut-2-enyl diphosphate reductase IspH